MMAGMLFLFLILISGSVFGSAVWKWRSEEALPLTCCGIVAVMYGAGLAGKMAAGVTIVCVISLILFLWSAVNVIRQKTLGAFCKRFFTPGLLLYVLMFIILILMHVGRVANDWDEFSHWMDIVKVMVLFDDFGTNPLAASAFQSYPPGMALFQYFAHEIAFGFASSGEMTEWICYFAYHVFTFSFLFPFLKQLKFKQIGPAAFFVIGVCLIPMALFPGFLDTVYIDPFIGFVSGCGFAMLYLHRCTEWKNSLYVFAAMFALVLAKDAAILFAVFLAIGMAAKEGLQKGDLRQKAKRLLLAAGGAAVFILLPKMLWELHLNLRNAERAFSESIDVSVLINVLIGRDDSYRKTVLLNFLRSLLVDGRAVLNNSLYLTLPVMCLMLFTGLCWFHQEARRSNGSEQKEAGILWVAVIQTCIYILGLCVTYMFKFSEYEAITLASFERYCSIALLAVLMLLALMAFDYLIRHASSWVCLLLITVAFSLLPGDSLLQFINRGNIYHAVERQRPFKETAAQAKEVLGDENARVYIVAQGSNGFEYWILKYHLRPCLFNEDGWSLSPDGPLYSNDIWSVARSAEEWQNELKAYDYVLLYKADDTFVQHYSVLFENPELIQERALFRVDPQTGLLALCE